MLAALCAGAAAGETIWVEGENPAESSVARNAWYATFDPAKLSGGGLITHMGRDEKAAPGSATYRFDAAKAAEYRLWLRVNASGDAKMSLQVNGAAWAGVDMKKARCTLIAAPGSTVDLRWLSWVDGGTVGLKKGANTLAVRFESPKHNRHGAMDCFVLSTEKIEPWERPFKPGAGSPKSSAAVARGGVIWVEGEKPVVDQMARHPWWYGKLNAPDLSAGGWIEHFHKDQPGHLLYRLDAPDAGKRRLWLRANPAGASISFRVNGGAWVPVDVSKATDRRNVAAGGAVDIRFIAWMDLGEVALKKGPNTVAFRMDSKNDHHGLIDCFVLAKGPFTPEGTRKPWDAAPAGLDEKAHWRFEPKKDTFSPDALLDLRSLNEEFAGEHGFIKQSADGGDFVRGDGEPIRFWAVNSYVWRDKTGSLPEHARFLAKRGVNMVRYHSSIVDAKGGDLKAINAKERDQLWKYVATMKKAGIYLTLSAYYPHAVKPRKEWGLNADQPNMTGLLFFHPKVQAAYKQWLREILLPKNPYTGVSLKDEPAIAIFQIQNEDSLLFWTVGQIKAEPLRMLQKLFGDWARKKYGSAQKVAAAWKAEKVAGDDAASGRYAFRHIWDMTEDGIKQKGRPTQRLADQAQFLTEVMREANAEILRFLREEIGAKHLVNAGNWRTADPVLLNDLERYSYASTEVLGMNRYTGCVHIGKYNGWAIVSGDRFDKPSRLTTPLDLPVNLKQAAGHPIIIPESMWVPPMYYQSEGPFLVSAYSSLSGVDTFYWFATGEVGWRHPASANGYLPSIGKWVLATPETLGNFPGAALLYRRGYLQRGRPVVREQRSLADMYRLRVPLISEEGAYDPNRDKGAYAPKSKMKQEVNRLAFLVGPVEVVYGGEPSKSFVLPDLSKYIDQPNKTVRSITGQLALDHGKGVCTMNAPKAQGASGFLKKAGAIRLADVTLTCENDYATVIVASLDALPIRSSKKVLVQVGTACRPTGWQERAITWRDKKGKKHEGFEVVKFGKAPWQVVRNRLTVGVRNAGVTKAVALDMNGMARETLKADRKGDELTFTVPPDCKYVVLQ